MNADASPGKDSGQNVWKPMRLRDGESDRRACGIAPFRPCPAKDGTGYTQERAR